MKKERVNGQDLAQHIGEEAILLGEVKEINPLGKSVQLRAPDDTIVNVTLPTPINEYCDGYLEVWGTIQSKSTMSCFSYVFFPRTMFKKHEYIFSRRAAIHRSFNGTSCIRQQEVESV
ncbi:uncharacterized protein LOC105700882 isoform X2 [Orussus abietinus]|uniref:uncharacterized protein LOC105700882 isoform X2 n=1 Tax=Orussus abietinus TaxID=222816 RepID=UPI0006253889|nr:uncharacterized protein LOC105700882 isoform X2 [Orussus abietinus]